MNPLLLSVAARPVSGHQRARYQGIYAQNEQIISYESINQRLIQKRVISGQGYKRLSGIWANQRTLKNSKHNNFEINTT